MINYYLQQLSKLWFWGYIDIHWEINLRNYYTSMPLYNGIADVLEAKKSSFVLKVVEPFVADSKESAMRILEIERLVLEGEKKGQGGGWNMDL